jgi:hypothetical protein
MTTSPLWLFAHHALSPQFHRDPAQFVRLLDSPVAPRFLEDMWSWALKSSGHSQPERPPLSYGIDRPRAGVVVIAMRFEQVAHTGEPWEMRFFARDPSPDGTGAYYRVFLLEYSEYASEQGGGPSAILCENTGDGTHRNWGVVLSAAARERFDEVVMEKLRASVPT